MTMSPAAGSGVEDVAVGIATAHLPHAPGLYSATLTATGAGSRESATLAVTLVVEAPRFLLPQQSVALTSEAGSAAQLQVAPVLDTASAGIPFTVEASESWVSVEGNTTTGGNLSIGAAARLSPGPHRAAITIRTDDARFAHSFEAPPPVTLNVVVYVSEQPLASTVTAQLPPTARQLIGDPVRPYVYVIVEDRSLEAYDVETGERVASRSFSSRLGSAVIAPDGDKLYIAESGSRQIHALTVPDLGESRAFAVGAAEPTLALLHCAGRSQLWSFTDELQVFDVDSGTELTLANVPTLNASGAPRLVGSPSGDTLFVLEPGVTPLRAFDIHCSSIAPEPLRMRWRATAPPTVELLLWQPQISADGSTVCVRHTCLDAGTLEPLTALPPAATEALSNREFSQLVFGTKGGIFVGDTGGKVMRFDSQWQHRGEVQVMRPTTPGIAPPQYQLALTGDERRLLSFDDRAALSVRDAH